MTARRDHAIAVRRMLTLMAIVLCSFAITVDADAAPEGRRCKSEPTESENIAYGDLITCSIDTVGDSEIFRFNAKIGEKISIRATRTNIFLDPCIQLRGPDGVVLDSSCGGNAAALDLAARGESRRKQYRP